MMRQQTLNRELGYKTKNLNLGYQLLMVKDSLHRSSVLISPAKPRIHLEAQDAWSGATSRFEFLCNDEGLHLVSEGKCDVPVLLDGKPLNVNLPVYLGHGSVLQIGDEIIKIKQLQTKLGSKGVSTQRVYSAERRYYRRQDLGKKANLTQAIVLAGIVVSVIALKLFLL